MRTNFVPSGEANAIEPEPTYGVYDVKRVYEFTESQVGGQNLTEWGFGPTSSASSGTMNRELFRDGLGNPIVLTLDTDQRLRLIYRYRITLTPTTAQDITVNIGGVGPGPRTAKFLLTGMFSTQGDPSSYSDMNFKGIVFNSVNSTERQRRGDLIIAEVLASGAIIAGAGQVCVTNATAPPTYLHTEQNFSGSSNFDKNLTYDAPIGRSRKAGILLNTTEAVLNIKILRVLPHSSTPAILLSTWLRTRLWTSRMRFTRATRPQ